MFVLQDKPFSILKENESAYEILILRDLYDNKFKDIAVEMGISVERVRQKYNKRKVLQARLYIRHLSVALGHDNSSLILKEYQQAEAFYIDRTFAVAYFEIKYGDILSEYRGGEPVISKDFLDKVPPLIIGWDDKEVEASIVQMRDVEQIPFKKIAEQYCITVPKAKHIYESYYHKQFMKLVRKIDELENERNAGLRYYDRARTGKKRIALILEEHPELRDENES